MRKLALGLVGATALAFASTSATAAEVTITVGDLGPVPDNNDFQGDLALLGLTQLATTGTAISLDEMSVITFELLGTESGFDDRFDAAGVSFTETGGTLNLFGSPQLLGSDTFLAGLLSAHFSSEGDSGDVGTENFAVFLDALAKTGDEIITNVFYLGFDDQITGDDDDYDDLIIRATVSPAVPEPATWAMMFLGFGAVGFALRRRKETELAIRQIA